MQMFYPNVDRQISMVKVSWKMRLFITFQPLATSTLDLDGCSGAASA